MTEVDIETLVKFFGALANESRLKIVGLLSTQERSVNELADLLDLREPTISHHLARLRDLGLVEMRSEGNTHFYRLNRASLDTLGRQIFSGEGIPARWADERDEGDAWTRKVLNDYVQDGRLKAIPTKQKKLLVILHWIMERFEPGRRYPEREVNAIIGAIHPDFAALRRDLVDFGFMQRKDGVYWVAEGYDPAAQ